MKKNSDLTLFIGQKIKKMKEIGITSFLTKRYLIPEANCKSLHKEGKSLGMEKFASLFVFYSMCCVFSLIILVLENIIKPTKNNLFPKQYSDNTIVLNMKLNALQEELEICGTREAINLLNDIRALSKSITHYSLRF